LTFCTWLWPVFETKFFTFFKWWAMRPNKRRWSWHLAGDLKVVGSIPSQNLIQSSTPDCKKKSTLSNTKSIDELLSELLSILKEILRLILSKNRIWKINLLWSLSNFLSLNYHQIENLFYLEKLEIRKNLWGKSFCPNKYLALGVLRKRLEIKLKLIDWQLNIDDWWTDFSLILTNSLTVIVAFSHLNYISTVNFRSSFFWWH